MNNVKSVISNHNKRILRNTTPTKKSNCNCRNPSECPLKNNCLTTSVVYKAEVKTSEADEVKQYIGMTSGTFKKRYANHKKSFNNVRHSNETELSKYVWHLKNNGKSFDINWSILKRAPAVAAGGKRCGLCTEEKLCLLKAHHSKKASTLNKRSEIFSKCRHADRFSAGKFKRQENVSTCVSILPGVIK